MNWFTKGTISANSAISFIEKHKDDGCCEHVEKDKSLARGWVAENDSMGRELTILCAECVAEQNEHDANEEVTCCDCKLVKLAKDTSEYKWYDFYRPQGDEPLIICKECWEKPKHQARLANDKAQMDWDDDDDDDDYQSGPEDFC